jgi:hypothetical protein
VQTDRTIPNKTPYIITHDSKQGTCILIDVAIPAYRNAIKEEGEKTFIYKNLIIEIRCMWNVKAKVIPVIIGGIGTTSKSLRQYLSNIPGKHEIKKLQKQPYWALAHTTESANVKVQIIFHGRNNITCSTNCKHKTAATPSTLGTWFCFRYIIVNTLNKGDNKDNNNIFLVKEKGSIKGNSKSGCIHASIDMCLNTAPKNFIVSLCILIH